MKTVDIIYRYEAGDTSAKPPPADSNAALLRLDHGNPDFAALLHVARNRHCNRSVTQAKGVGS